ncbi:MAG: ABC transporter permease [Nitrososphaerota archaeon]|nr:ABC transporter permease [Nitrososphaerota archaeon]MDG6941460.1 ABC transporter permease [Nitrososphaerota archaeon]
MNWLRAFSLIVVFLLLVPILVLLYYGLGPLRSPEGFAPLIFRSIELSLASSAVAALVDFGLFTPLAYYLARSGDTFLEALVDIPVGVPHPIIGVALLILDSPLTPTGQFLLRLGVNFFDSLLGLVIALVIMSAPIYVKSIQPYFESKDVSVEEYAMGLGASRLRTLVSVVLPDSTGGVTSASLVAMSRALGEFGSISIIAFYVLQYPFNGVSPASVTIFQLFNGAIPGGLEAAVTASAVMILVSLPIAVAGHFFGRRARR